MHNAIAAALSAERKSVRPHRTRDAARMAQLRTDIKQLRPDIDLRQLQDCAEILYDFMEDMKRP
jgi:hypothetical protein